MGIRGELFSTKVSCEGRTYFFNVKQNRMGDVFLSIVESKPTEAESFDRRSIVVFRDDLRGFLKAFQATLGYMEKPGSARTEMTFEPKDEPAPRPRGIGAAGLGATGTGATGKTAATKSAGAKTSEGGTPGAGTEKKRRVVVRKKPSAGEPESK